MAYQPQHLRRWTRPDSYFGAEWPDYFSAGFGQSRDSDALERSNFAVALRDLGGESDAQRGSVFCPKCAGSEYLKETELHLTRLLPVDRSGVGAKREPLTAGELTHLLPIYREAQREGSATRASAAKAKARENVLAKFAKATADATTERDGMLWLLDRGIGTGNVIFYPHTGRFGFGWRSDGLSPEQTSVVLDYISEFPFPYDIQCADGRKLSGN